MTLFRKRRRWQAPTFAELGLSSDDHAGVCLNRGQVNSSFSGKVCECTGWEFDKVFYGQPFCKCGDSLLQHGRKEVTA